jgi:shikimate 5-dehydrogenase
VPASDGSVEQNRQASRRLLASVGTGTLVSDVVLRDGPTPTLALAHGLGLPTLDGVGMVIHQGVAAFGLVHETEMRQGGIRAEDVAAIMTQEARR